MCITGKFDWGHDYIQMIWYSHNLRIYLAGYLGLSDRICDTISDTCCEYSIIHVLLRSKPSQYPHQNVSHCTTNILITFTCDVWVERHRRRTQIANVNTKYLLLIFTTVFTGKIFFTNWIDVNLNRQYLGRYESCVFQLFWLSFTWYYTLENNKLPSQIHISDLSCMDVLWSLNVHLYLSRVDLILHVQQSFITRFWIKLKILLIWQRNNNWQRKYKSIF